MLSILHVHLIASSFVCKFDFVPSQELSEDGALDGGLVGEGAHRTQALPQGNFGDTILNSIPNRLPSGVWGLACEDV